MTKTSIRLDVYSATRNIIDLNNAGAEALGSGDIPLARSTFQRALEASKSAIIAARAEGKINAPPLSTMLFDIDSLILEQQAENSTGNGRGNSCTKKIPSSSIPSSLKNEVRNNAIGDDNDVFAFPRTESPVSSSCCNYDVEHDNTGKNGFIFNKPIYIPLRCAKQADLQRSESILPSILVFNLALTHHMWGVAQFQDNDCRMDNGNDADHEQRKKEEERNKKAKRQYKKAAKMYKLSIQLLQQNDGSITEMCKLYLLLSLNNLGCVFGSLGEVETERDLHQELLTMLMYVTYNERLWGNSGGTNQRRHRHGNTTHYQIATTTIYESIFCNIFKTENGGLAPAA